MSDSFDVSAAIFKIMARTAAMASRWESGGQITMGAAGRDRRVRASPKVAPKVESKKVAKAKAKSRGKKRQPGARQESSENELPSSSRQDSVMESHFKNKIEKERKQPNIPDASESAQASASQTKRQYADPRAESPGRKRGRSAVFARSAVVNRYSLDGILTSPKCGKQAWKLEDRNKTSCLVRCRKCRFAETVVAHDKDLFCKRIPLRSAVGSLWLLCTMSMSPDSAGLILGLDSRTVHEQWDTFRGWLCPLVERMNNELKVGGPGVDVELDEVSFRSAGLEHSVLWIRFLGMVRRGSSKIFLAKLPYRLTAAGQGGGGPLSMEELRSASLV